MHSSRVQGIAFDEDNPIISSTESTSVLMGHASTKTTEGFYSRKRLDMAIENAIGTALSKSSILNCFSDLPFLSILSWFYIVSLRCSDI